VENIAIGSNECWDLSKTVELQVLSINTFGRLGVDNLEVDVVGLCDCEDCSAAGVTLKREKC